MMRKATAGAARRQGTSRTPRPANATSHRRSGQPSNAAQQAFVAGKTCGSRRVVCASSTPLNRWSTPATAAVRPRPASEAFEWDVLGVGQAAVDCCVSVDDSTLALLNVPKGGRRLISVAERASVMQSLEDHDTQVNAGGSLANTLVGLAQLGAAQERAAARLVHQQQQHSCTTTSSLACPANSDPQQGHNSSSSSSHQRHHHQQQHRVALTGPVTGADALGEFAAAQLRAAGVAVVGAQPSGGSTGTVVVFSTPDAQRSFLSCFGNEDSIALDTELCAAVSRARLLIIEGYLWEVQGAADAIPSMVQHARANGTLVALTAGDAGVVQRHASKVLGAIAAGVDILFSNEAEAAALVAALKEQQHEQQLEADEDSGLSALSAQQLEEEDQGRSALEDAEEDFTAVQLLELCSSGSSLVSEQSSASPAQAAALQLASICPMVAVTEGSRGSYITAQGQLVVVPPFWKAEPPVDTCGAGDAWAAGFLHGFITGLDLHCAGHLAAKTASAVISRHGPQLLPEDADWVLQGLSRPAAGLPGLTVARAAAAAADGAAGSASLTSGRSSPEQLAA